MSHLLRQVLPAVAGYGRRSITSKAVRSLQDIVKHPPWPYKERSYERLSSLFDWTTKRLDENSKLILVEGNIGSGKSKLGKELADALGFHYIPEPSMDNLLVNSYGIDRRDFYHLLPERCRFFDAKMFYENPSHPNVARFQYDMFFAKYEAYMNALAHILNTGQGVVLERSPYSDMVFVEAMFKKKYITPEFYSWYYKLRDNTLPFLKFEPHVIIYLDSPVDRCMENIKKRGIPSELSTKVLDFVYLDAIEKAYKRMIKERSDQCELIVYDWSKGGDVDSVVEDLESRDLDTYEWHRGDKFETWKDVRDEMEWNGRRWMYTKKTPLYRFFNVPHWEVEELFIHPADFNRMIRIYRDNVYGKYMYGYNADKGDNLWKMMWKLGEHGVAMMPRWWEYAYKDLYWYRVRDFFYEFDDREEVHAEPPPGHPLHGQHH